jgi:hypothetical protein
MYEELGSRIDRCIAVETACAEIYHAFSEMFPEARDFWRQLALEEENHATILIVGKGLQRTGKLPEDFMPPSGKALSTVCLKAEVMKRKVRSGKISLSEALEMALSLEKLLCESYFMEMMAMRTDSEALARLQRLHVFTKSHVEKIREFVRSAGFEL